MGKYEYDYSRVVAGDVVICLLDYKDSCGTFTKDKIYITDGNNQIKSDLSNGYSGGDTDFGRQHFKKLRVEDSNCIIDGDTVVLMERLTSATAGNVFSVDKLVYNGLNLIVNPTIKFKQTPLKEKFKRLILKDEEITKPGKIEVGDVVRVTKRLNIQDSAYLDIGEKFTVFKVFENDIYYRDGFSKNIRDVELVRKGLVKRGKCMYDSSDGCYEVIEDGMYSPEQQVAALVQLRDLYGVSYQDLVELCKAYIPNRYVDITTGMVCKGKDTQNMEQTGNLPEKKEDKMMNNKVEAQLDENKRAVILAAEITAGKVLNNKVVQLIKPKLPMMIRGYADSPLVNVAVANIVGMAIKQYAFNNPKARQVSDLMLKASALQAMEAFDVEGMLNDLLEGINLPELSQG